MNFIRYADDFVITGRSKELLEGEVKPLVEQFLQQRGLSGLDRSRGDATASLFHQESVKSPHRDRHLSAKSWGCGGNAPVAGQSPALSSHTRAMIEALLLGRQYGYAALKESLEKALDLSCFDVEALRLLLTAERNGKRPPGEAVEIGALRSYDRPQPTTKNYDQLLENYPAGGVLQ